MNSLLKEITIFIPTRNRPHFLNRLLRYYQEVQFPGSLFIGDASDPDFVKQNRKICEAFQNDLEIRFFETPEVSTHQSIEAMAAEAETRYATSVCDDDFLCLEGLAECAAFLDQNSDYVGAHGKGLMFSIHGGGAYGQIHYSQFYPQAVIEEERPIDRLKSYFEKGGAVVFTLYRTADWKKMFQNPQKISRYQITFIFGELVNASVAVIRGKIKELDCLYLLRQVHAKQKMAELDIYKWFIHPEWYATYQFLSECVVGELHSKSGLNSDEAYDLFEKTFGSYLVGVFRKYFPLQFEKKKSATILKKISNRLYRFRKDHVGKDPMALTQLLHPKSPYYNSFKPFYQVITGGSA